MHLEDIFWHISNNDDHPIHILSFTHIVVEFLGDPVFLYFYLLNIVYSEKIPIFTFFVL